MISSKVTRIKSGWRSVFMIFTAAADDDLESIVEKSFENVEQGRFYFYALNLELVHFFFVFLCLLYFPVLIIFWK